MQNYLNWEWNIKHCFNEIEKHAENIKLIAGPIYLSDTAKHSFSEISKQVESIKSLVGPVYVDGKSNYNEIQQMAESFKNLNGPVYVKKGEKYSFNELLPVPDSLKPINGPVYMHGNTSHNFSEVAKKVEGLKDLCGGYRTFTKFDFFVSAHPIISANLGNTSHKKKRFLSGIAQITFLSPPPNSVKLYSVFGRQV